MFDYTNRQHFQFGYAKPGRALTEENVQWMCHRKNSEDEFVAKYGRAKDNYGTWREANKAAALLILKNCRDMQLTPLICYSGGLDSEIVLVAFLEARKEFDPEFPIELATLDLEGELNRHDTDFVDRFKNRLTTLGHSPIGLQFHRRKLDAIKFWNSPEFLALAKETQIVSPIVICQAWLCGEMLHKNSRYLPVIGQGEIHLVKDTPKDYHPGLSPYTPSTWRIAETENLCGLYRFFIGRQAPAVPGFFQFLPEQFETQLRTNPMIHELVSNTRIGKLGTRSSKREIILFDYPELEARPKYHGFETIEAEHDIWRKRLNEMMPECEGHWYLDFYSLYRSLRPEITGVFEHGDWSATIGRAGRYRLRRLDDDDIFTSEWKSTTNPVLDAWNRHPSEHCTDSSSPDKMSGTVPANLLVNVSGAEADKLTRNGSGSLTVFTDVEAAIQKFLSTGEQFILAHDGSLVARWLHALKPDLKVLGAAQVPRLRPHQVIPDVLETDLMDVNSLLVFLLAKSAKAETLSERPNKTGLDSARLLLPRINSRIEFGSRPVWIESERDARLVFNLRSHFTERQLAIPFCDFQIQFEVAKCLRALGPKDWQLALECRVAELEEKNLSIDDVQSFASQADAVRRRLAGYLERLTRPTFATMNSSTVLSNSSTEIGKGLEGIETAISAKGLTSISIDEWASRAKLATPDLKVGGNLFFRQTVYGRQLISQNFRKAVALKSLGGEILCTACVQILDPPPAGTLRIRGIVTEPPFRRQGHAKELIARLSEALRASPAICSQFAKLEVWAAPEIVNAFTFAGFQSDNNQAPLDEPLYVTSENKLLPSGRILKPMLMALR